MITMAEELGRQFKTITTTGESELNVIMGYIGLLKENVLGELTDE